MCEPLLPPLVIPSRREYDIIAYSGNSNAIHLRSTYRDNEFNTVRWYVMLAMEASGARTGKIPHYDHMSIYRICQRIVLAAKTLCQ